MAVEKATAIRTAVPWSARKQTSREHPRVPSACLREEFSPPNVPLRVCVCPRVRARVREGASERAGGWQPGAGDSNAQTTGSSLAGQGPPVNDLVNGPMERPWNDPR